MVINNLYFIILLSIFANISTSITKYSLDTIPIVNDTFIKQIIIFTLSVSILILSNKVDYKDIKQNIFTKKYIPTIINSIIISCFIFLSSYMIQNTDLIEYIYIKQSITLILSVIIGFFIFKEKINKYSIVGIIMIFIGIYFIQKE